MRKIEIELFKFNELSDDSKEKARDAYRADGLGYEWWDGVFENIKSCATFIGINIDDIFFSGFWSQGDGALFVGSYSYKKGWKKELQRCIGGDDLKSLMNIGSTLQEIQKNYAYSLSATCQQSGRYSHSGCMDVTVYTDKLHKKECFNDAEESLRDELRNFADWAYRCIEREYDYLNSDGVIDELLITYGCEFKESGELY